ncbi:MAG: hypothetical protein U0694_12690 [Anaerolineae bacterium]
MDEKTQTQEIRRELDHAKQRRLIIIVSFVFGLVALGGVVSLISNAVGKSDFGTNFLTEMMGSAITLVMIEIVFNRLEQRAEEDIKRKQMLLEETIRTSAKHVSEELIPHMVANSLRAAYDQNEEVNADTILAHLHQHKLIKNEHLDEFRKRSVEG